MEKGVAAGSACSRLRAVGFVLGYLRGAGSDSRGLVPQLQEHRFGRVPLGHLLVGPCSRGDLAVDFYLSHTKRQNRLS